MSRQVRAKRHGTFSIIAVAVATIGLSGWVWLIDPHSFEPKEDSAQYHNLAWNLAERGVLSLEAEPPYEPSARRTPGYPLFLAAVYSVAGPSVEMVKLVQVFFAPLWCVLTFFISRRVLGRDGPALAAAWLAAVLPPLLTVSNSLMTEALFTALLLGNIYCTYRWIDAGSAGWAVGSGLLWGALGLMKPEAALLPAAVLPVAVWLRGNWRQGVGEALLAGALCGALIGVWMYRNHAVLGRACLISGQGSGDGPGMLRTYRLRAENGFTFRPERYTYLYGDGWKRLNEDFEAAMDGSVANPEESDVEFWLKRPHLVVKYSLVRFVGLMKPTSWSRTFGLDRDFSQLSGGGGKLLLATKAGLLLFDVLVLAFCGIGFLHSLRLKNKRLWIVAATILYFVAVYSLLHGIPRYRVPLLPLGLILGCAWFSSVLPRRKAQAAAATEAETPTPVLA